ncbi:MAG: Jag N-terminal domain-containing protein [Oscillibacter sp.]|nr:Jag N-terminal domain-containing protein [Oscillibacter sp.]
MREYIDVTGKDEAEAVQNALAQLSLERDDVSVEILERAKAGFLGLGSCPAKVRVYYGPEDESDAETAAPKAKKEEKPKAERKPRVEKVKTEKAPKEPAPKVERAAVPATGDMEEAHDERSEEIRRFLTGLLNQMDVVAEVRVYLPEKGRYKVVLDGENMGSVIGRRGETLDAIQQLTSYSVNRTGSRVRIQMDAENYRAKREQSLEHLAKKVAAKVTKYRRSVTLEPINAYERHVIHTALQDEPGITTYSTGVDPNRRVIVAYDREKA